MDKLYLGKLDCTDPLYDMLCSEIYPDVKNPFFNVTRMSFKRVYKYTEEKTQMAVIGKFFKLNDTKHDKILRIKGEYDNLQKIRRYGFDSFPYYVVRPISRKERIGLALIEEFIHGKDLDYYLKKSIYEGDSRSLKKQLAKLACFLYVLHSRTVKNGNVELDLVSTYFQRILNKLYTQGILSDCDRRIYLKLMDKWLNRHLLNETKKCHHSW